MTLPTLNSFEYFDLWPLVPIHLHYMRKSSSERKKVIRLWNDMSKCKFFVVLVSLFHSAILVCFITGLKACKCRWCQREVRRGCLSPRCAGILTPSFYSICVCFCQCFCMCSSEKLYVGCAVFKMAYFWHFQLLAHRLGKFRCVTGFNSVCCRELFWVLNKQPACNH